LFFQRSLDSAQETRLGMLYRHIMSWTICWSIFSNFWK